MNDDIVCPYCFREQEINLDDGRGTNENELDEQDCIHCDKTFIYSTSISYLYEARKAPCLNGEKHKYQITHTFPFEFAKMECSICEHRRQLTKAEYQKLIED